MSNTDESCGACAHEWDRGEVKTSGIPQGRCRHCRGLFFLNKAWQEDWFWQEGWSTGVVKTASS